MNIPFKIVLTGVIAVLSSCNSNKQASNNADTPAVNMDTAHKILQSDSISAKGAEPDTFPNGAGEDRDTLIK